MWSDVRNDSGRGYGETAPHASDNHRSSPVSESRTLLPGAALMPEASLDRVDLSLYFTAATDRNLDVLTEPFELAFHGQLQALQGTTQANVLPRGQRATRCGTASTCFGQGEDQQCKRITRTLYSGLSMCSEMRSCDVEVMRRTRADSRQPPVGAVGSVRLSALRTRDQARRHASH
jgi:hypothetical protein